MSTSSWRKACIICSSPGIRDILDAGRQPLSNRYLRARTPREYKHPLVLGLCTRCGILQNKTPVPIRELRPRFVGLTYREAERHLDRLVDIIEALPSVSQMSAIWGLSFKDRSTLDRFKHRGYGQTYAVDATADLGVRNAKAGLETIQQRVSSAALDKLAKKRGHADVLIARHILEHAYEPRRFLKQLQSVLRPGGHLVIEVPDCQRAIETGDYTMIWEDHILYFTPQTLQRAIKITGFAIEKFRMFPYPMENALALVVTPLKRVPKWEPASVSELKAVQRYGQSFAKKREEFQKNVQRLKAHTGKLALLGAGHLSCHFVNLMGLKGYIDYMLDDDPQKQGLLMPGSHMVIRHPDILREAKVKFCLLGVSAESEEAVLKENQAFLNSGGQFLSIFPGARNSVVPFLSQASTPS